MLLPSRKPSSSYSLLKFVYVTSQLRHSLVVHPLLRKILDPPLILNLEFECNKFYVKEGMDQDLFLEGVPGEQFFCN